MFGLAIEKKSLLKRFIACLCAFAFACALIPAATFAAPAAYADEGFSNLDVPYRSERSIVNYYEKNVKTLYQNASYATSPKTSAPYSAGSPSDSTLNQALATLNFARYVAGLDDVQLDVSCTKSAQAAALLTAVNGKLSNSPSRPASMADALYNEGKSGASNSNLYRSGETVGLGTAIVDGWLDDSDSSNISSLGHRRWMLNPKLSKTGFGIVANSSGVNGYNTWAAMHTTDQSGTSSATTVAWPAETTPVELFNSDSAWSLSVGTKLDKSKVKVKVTGDGKTWNFSAAKSDGEFYVDNNSYGEPGCIIFRPKGIDVSIDNIYTVQVTGIPNPVEYNVNFIGLEENSITSVSLSGTSFSYTGSAIKPTVTVKSYDRLLTPGAHYSVTYSNNVDPGTATVTVRGKGDYEGSVKTARFTIKGNSDGSSGGNGVPSGNGGSGSGGGSGSAASSSDDTQVMYRLYNPNSGEHFYTASAYERDSVKASGWKYEGIGWTAPKKSKTPVYRLYSGTDHHYTTSAVERDSLKRAGWKYEGIGWYSDDAKGVPLYRQFNPNVDPKAPRNNSGSHNYTTSRVEHNHLVSIGWRGEGTGWYGVK